MNPEGVLIFSGYNERGIVAFCRFCQKHGIPFFVVAAHAEDKIFHSSYYQNVIYIRKNQDLTIEDMQRYRLLVSARLSGNNTGTIVILPSTEFLNRFLLGERKKIETIGYTIPLCPEEVYQTISDKYSFCFLCQQYGIPTPRELPQNEYLTPPFVIKPKTYFVRGSKKVNIKPILVKTVAEWRKIQAFPSLQEIFVQEFIEGQSIYLLFYFGKNRDFHVYSQENFMQQSDGRSIIAARSSEFHKFLDIQPYFLLFQNLGFEGLVMVEIRYSQGIPYMIEANPRLWGPSQLINDAGMQLFTLWAKDLGLIKDLPQYEYQIGATYFWTGGILEDSRLGKSVTFHNYSKEQFFDEYDQWLQGDVYLRDDTIGIFLREVRG
ncbi:MAG: hypothetical protein ACP5Q4_01255 [Candidatus Caldatribacteriaceae bacterium]